MSKVDVFLARIRQEEGERNIPYDDATGYPVYAPKGNLTWGRGFNLMKCGDSGLYDVMDRYLAQKHDHVLSGYGWYNRLDDIVGSVPLDIAYNAGDAGELLYFPKMIQAFERGDIVTAANECTVSNAALDSTRYAALRRILIDWVKARTPSSAQEVPSP